MYRDPTFLYLGVLCSLLLGMLRASATESQATDRIRLLNKMQIYFKKASGLPQYINMLVDLQKRALRINRNDPITDATILGLAVADVMKSGQHPRLEEDYSHTAPANKTWAEWQRLALKEFKCVETWLAAQG